MAKNEINGSDELLFRNIHPKWMDNGIPTSQAFRPTPKDDKRLSVDQSSKTTAQGSYETHTNKKNLLSSGIFGVSVGEFNEEKVVCVEDPLEDNRAHALADYTNLGSNNVIEKTAKKIKKKAIKRGILYPA